MPRTLNGYHVVTTLLVTFAVVLAVNVLFIVKAYTTFRGEDEQKPYLQGIEYNDTLNRRALQTRLGWKATVTAARMGTNRARIAVFLSDRNGAPISHISLEAYLRHPSDSGRDHKVDLRPMGEGIYEGTADDVQAGAWDLNLVAPSAVATPFEADRRIWLH